MRGRRRQRLRPASQGAASSAPAVVGQAAAQALAERFFLLDIAGDLTPAALLYLAAGALEGGQFALGLRRSAEARERRRQRVVRLETFRRQLQRALQRGDRL